MLTNKEWKHQLQFAHAPLEGGCVSLDMSIRMYTKMCLAIDMSDQMLLRIVRSF